MPNKNKVHCSYEVMDSFGLRLSFLGSGCSFIFVNLVFVATRNGSVFIRQVAESSIGIQPVVHYEQCLIFMSSFMRACFGVHAIKLNEWPNLQTSLLVF